MDRSSVDWTGYWSAVVTPFDARGDLDLSALAAVVDWTIRNGADGILVNGSTGEYATQTLEEREEVADAALSVAAGRVPVLVNVSAPRPADAAMLARRAAEAGANGVLLAPPGLVRPTTAELLRYFEAVLGATSLPACIYNFPQESGHALSLEEISLLADLEPVVAVKQASADLRDTLGAIEICGERIRIFGHLLSALGATLLAAGKGDGYIGSAMLFGSEQPRFFRLVAAGRMDEAGAVARRIERGMQLLLGARRDGYNWAFGGMQATIKAAMTLQGIPGGFPRAPKLPLAIEQVAALRQVLEDISLLPPGAIGTTRSRE